jgi:hypothetical protein
MTMSIDQLRTTVHWQIITKWNKTIRIVQEYADFCGKKMADLTNRSGRLSDLTSFYPSVSGAFFVPAPHLLRTRFAASSQICEADMEQLRTICEAVAKKCA